MNRRRIPAKAKRRISIELMPTGGQSKRLMDPSELTIKRRRHPPGRILG